MSTEQLAGISTLAACVTAIAGVVAASAIYFLFRQVQVFSKQAELLSKEVDFLSKEIETTHERARREKAIELMQFYVRESKMRTSPMLLVGKFVESLTHDQCCDLYEVRPLKVGNEQKRAFFDCAHVLDISMETSHRDSNDEIELSRDATLKVRNYSVQSLNLLEAVAAAWRHHVADREILEEEFASILSTKKHIFFLDKFRKASEIYPSLEEFVKALKQSQDKRYSKPPVA